MGNQSLHSSSTSYWLSICHARKMNVESLSLFLCFHTLLRLNWSELLPLILWERHSVCSLKLESSEKSLYQHQDYYRKCVMLRSCVQIGVLQSPMYKSLIFYVFFFEFIYLLVYFAWVCSELRKQGKHNKASGFSWKNNQPSFAIKTTKASVISTRLPQHHY